MKVVNIFHNRSGLYFSSSITLLSYLSYKGLISLLNEIFVIVLYSHFETLVFKNSSTFSQENGKYGFNKVLTLEIIFTQLNSTLLHSFISVLTRIQGCFSSKYLLAKLIKSKILLIPSFTSPLSILFPTSSNKIFIFYSISLSTIESFKLPLKDLFTNNKVLFIKFPNLPNNSPLIELIKSFQVKLKSLFAGSFTKK